MPDLCWRGSSFPFYGGYHLLCNVVCLGNAAGRAREGARGGLAETVEDPYGAGFGLVLVGMFFASRLYRLRLLTIGDFYRRRYGQGIEVFASTVISLSYLGWVAAQITALGLVLEVLTQGLLSTADGMLVGTLVVLI